MQVSHNLTSISASFSEVNLTGAAGLVPVMALAKQAGLRESVDQKVKLPTDKGANAGLKVTALVAGMLSGADSIDDMGILRHGAMGKLFTGTYAPSTLGSFLRTFTFGHARQLQSTAGELLVNLNQQVPLLGKPSKEQFVFLDVDDTIIEVHGYMKQGAGYGYSKVRGLNALLGTVSTDEYAPALVSQRLRKGATHSARGAAHFIAGVVGTVKKMNLGGRLITRADSAYYSATAVAAALAGGAQVSVTVRMNKHIKGTIGTIDDQSWVKIAYPKAIFDEDTKQWISDAEVAEIPYTAFSSKKKALRVPGRLVVRRVAQRNETKLAMEGQEPMFQIYRYHAVFSTIPQEWMDTVALDKTHRQHAVIESVNAELKSGPLAHMPSGNFTANTAWLHAAAMAYNLTRAAGLLAGGRFTRAKLATIRQKLILVPARVASSARKQVLHLPWNWPWAGAWMRLLTSVQALPQTV
ncbi:IS1380 family transposase [Glutamicibacter sp. NPDC087344]|uniref:IS1380 family transposase n=1 Tax=Glutamicibacter sp. NPDC087344 TaxID=3363994 RepID=UPI0037F38629